jgi:hypothetical protein
MAVELWIDDGDPWYYLSSDIWVVPGNDPSGAIGVPIVNDPAYVWARVHNRGTTTVTNATVRYYWANPSMLITPSNATLIGTSFVSLLPGETKDVLCLTPWAPVWVNDGHECLIAEAFHASDPLPPRGPNDPFDPSSDRHVAQLNLGVALAQARMQMVIYCFAAGNAALLSTAEVTLRARRAPIETIASLKGNLGLKQLPKEMGEIKEFGLQPFRCGDQIEGFGKPHLALRLKSGEQRGLALAIQLPRLRDPKSGALFLVEQFVRDKVVGGIGALVIPEIETEYPKKERAKSSDQKRKA